MESAAQDVTIRNIQSLHLSFSSVGGCQGRGKLPRRDGWRGGITGDPFDEGIVRLGPGVANIDLGLYVDHKRHAVGCMVVFITGSFLNTRNIGYLHIYIYAYIYIYTYEHFGGIGFMSGLLCCCCSG